MWMTIVLFFLVILPPPRSTLFPYTTLFRSKYRITTVPCIALTTSYASFVLPWCLVVRAFFFSRNSRRSEEHTSELQSRQYLVCRLLLEKKKKSGDSAEELIPDLLSTIDEES